MNTPSKQHLIDPEICIRCHTCEDACTIGAISHNDDNVVVDATICDQCMDCIAPCPTGSIDNWRMVQTPYSVAEQLDWMELPEQAEMEILQPDPLTSDITKLFETAHAGAGGNVAPPASAATPFINLFPPKAPLTARVQGNFRLTSEGDESDVRHIILDLGTEEFPFLEGQSIAITPPGTNDRGKPHSPRLYSISSPRDGERAGFNNLSLTVKREAKGLCSNYLCDLQRDDTVDIAGPFGASFLIPNDPSSKLVMICTGTGSAPFRGFTMRRQRQLASVKGALTLYFGARTPESLPYFGPLNKLPDDFIDRQFAFSRMSGKSRQYVQDLMRKNAAGLGQMISDPETHIFICGLKDMETGVDEALQTAAQTAGLNWSELRAEMRNQGRYHVETY